MFQFGDVPATGYMNLSIRSLNGPSPAQKLRRRWRSHSTPFLTCHFYWFLRGNKSRLAARSLAMYNVDHKWRMIALPLIRSRVYLSAVHMNTPAFLILFCIDPFSLPDGGLLHSDCVNVAVLHVHVCSRLSIVKLLLQT